MSRTQKEEQILHILKDLKPFETIEIKRDERGNIVYIHTHKERHILFGEFDE